MKQRLSAVTSMVVGVVGFLLAAELVLRLLPYQEGLRVQPVNAANPILHFEPNRTSTWSQGLNFAMVNRGVRTNNHGFRNDQNYDPSLRTPLFAVIGDSNIESAMLPFQETTPARLAEAAKPGCRVYSFAASGAGFGQHLAWAEYARETFRPSGFMVLIISNDYQEALYRYQQTPAFHYLKERPDQGFDLVRLDYEPSLFRRALRHSAVFRYIALNGRAHSVLSRISTRQQNDRFVANMPALVPEQQIADMKRGVDAYLDQFQNRAGVDRSRIVFVVDGVRRSLYEATPLAAVKGSMAATMNAYFIEQAKARGYEVIDLTPIFVEHYAKERRRFEFVMDGHLNGLGHELISKAVLSSNAFSPIPREVTLRARLAARSSSKCMPSLRGADSE